MGCPVSASFRIFLASHDGAKPEANIFKIGDNNEAGVNRFIPVEEIWKERRYIAENIPAEAYPAAWCEGGNYVFINERKQGAVFFFDHEIREGFSQLAADFAEFLEVLEPFDTNTIELKPGQVKKVWIDPEFVKSPKNRL